MRGSLAEVEVFEEGAWIYSVYALHHIGLELELWVFNVWNVFCLVCKKQMGYFSSCFFKPRLTTFNFIEGLHNIKKEAKRKSQ